MNDVLTYCEDTEELIAEIREKFPIRLSKNGAFIANKTPTVRNGLKTISLIRCDDSELADLKSMTTLQVLGTYEEVFNDPVLKAIYDLVYIREYTYTDEEGIVIEGLKPEKIGVFA